MNENDARILDQICQLSCDNEEGARPFESIRHLSSNQQSDFLEFLRCLAVDDTLTAAAWIEAKNNPTAKQTEVPHE